MNVFNVLKFLYMLFTLTGPSNKEFLKTLLEVIDTLGAHDQEETSTSVETVFDIEQLEIVHADEVDAVDSDSQIEFIENNETEGAESLADAEMLREALNTKANEFEMASANQFSVNELSCESDNSALPVLVQSAHSESAFAERQISVSAESQVSNLGSQSTAFRQVSTNSQALQINVNKTIDLNGKTLITMNKRRSLKGKAGVVSDDSYINKLKNAP